MPPPRMHIPGGHLAIAVAAMLMIALGAAGCGGSNAAKHKRAPVITKAAFITKANAICAAADPALTAANAKLESHPKPAVVARMVRDAYVPSIETQIKHIRALGTPPGEHAIVAHMLALVQADLKRIERDPRLILTNVFGDFANVAHPYGLTACAPLS